ncbi:MAG: multidrug efflux SMR transporter [Gammaproteobacteria bacterium]
MKWIILILGIAANASASVMVKIAITSPYNFPSFTDPMAALRNWPFWSGLFLYGVAFLLYATSLSRLPLNVAYPILTSGAVATVALLSVVLFDESFDWTTGLGILFVILGVVLITSNVS